MEATYDNGASFNNLNQDIFVQKSNLQDFELNMDIKNTNVTTPSPDNLNNIEQYTKIDENKDLTSFNVIDNNSFDQNKKSTTEHVDFIFGGQDSNNSFVMPTINGKRRDEDFEVGDDFGPETDVDAVDEAMLTPVDVPDYEFDDTNKLVTTNNSDIQDISTKPNDDLTILDINQIADNKLLETVVEGIESGLKKDIDFSEKREYSFECEEFEKELDHLSDAKIEIPKEDEKAPNSIINNYDFNYTQLEEPLQIDDLSKLNSFIVPESDHEPGVAAVENVVVESGEESEDEWNYIKVSKEEKHIEKFQELGQEIETEEQIADKPSINEHNDNSEINEDFQGEIKVEELHAVSQASAVSQETCSDLLHGEEEKPDPELVALEAKAERELTEEEMASQLNPDAAEFVPVSPTRTTPVQSNFDIDDGVNQLLRPALLSERDCIIAQSPRKGTPMDDIALPTEDDFDVEISKRPAEFEESNIAVSAVPHRPDSSSSQHSYQEMNLKEAMHGDEKQEYAPEDLTATPENGCGIVDESKGEDELNNLENVDHEQFIQSLGRSIREQDPMNRSFYNDGSNHSTNPFIVDGVSCDMNAVHVLPTASDDDEEEESGISKDNIYAPGAHFEIQDTEFGMNEISTLEHELGSKEDTYKNEIVSDFIKNNNCEENDQTVTSPIVQAVQEMASDLISLLNDTTPSDNVVETTDLDQPDESHFEAEHIVEKIILENNDKYVDSSFSPDVIDNSIAIVSDTLYSLPESKVENNKLPIAEELVQSIVSLEQEESAPKSSEPNEVAHQAPPEEALKDDISVVEAVSVAAVASSAVATVKTELTKTAASTKKPDAKTRTTATTAVAAKKTTSNTTKPLAASSTAKPSAPIKKPTVVASKSTAGPTPRPRTVPSSTSSVTKTTVAEKKSTAAAVNLKKIEPAASTARRVLSSTVTSTVKSSSGTTATKTTSARLTAAKTDTTKTTSTARPITNATSRTLTAKTAGASKAPIKKATTTIKLSNATTTATGKPITDKLAKEATNQLTSSRATKASTALSPRSTTVKKVDSITKSPISSTMRTITTKTTISPITKKTPSTTITAPLLSTTNKRPTTTLSTRTTLAPPKRPTSSISPNAKAVASKAESTKKTTTTVSKDTIIKNKVNGTHNGDANTHLENEKDFNKLINGGDGNDLLQLDEQPPNHHHYNTIIDSSAD